VAPTPFLEGAGDGGAKLWLVDPWAAAASDAVQALGVALCADQRHILSLDLCLGPVAATAAPAAAVDASSSRSSGGKGQRRGSAGWQLLLAAGKALGGVTLWRSTPFVAAGASPGDIAAVVAAGSAVAAAGGHGCAGVTGVSIDPWAPGVVSCCLGGAAAAWRLDAARGSLVPAASADAAAATPASAPAPPPRLNTRARLPRGLGVPLDAAGRARAPLFGLAASGNRLVVAAVRSLSVAGKRGMEGPADAKASRMTYNRVARGWLQLLLTPSCGGSPAEEEGALPEGMACALAALPLAPAPAAAIWDVAAGVALAGWRRIELPAGAAAAPAAPPRTVAALLAARAAQRERQQVVREAEVQAQWLTLQRAAAALLARCPSGAAGAPLAAPSTGTGAVPWRALQAATALRWALLRLWQGPQQVGRDFPAATAQLQPQIAAAEMRLVQRHVWRALTEGLHYCSSGGGGSDDSSGSGEPPASKQQQTGKAGKAHGKQGKHGKQPHAPPQQERGRAGGVALPPAPGGPARLPLLLMTDWCSLQAGAPELDLELLKPVAAFCSQTGTPPVLPGQAPPAREANPFGASLPRVALAGAGLQAARQAPAAIGGGSGGAATALAVPRCAATLQLCPGRDAWRCPLCERRYLQLPTRGQGGRCEDVPRCLVCGVRLACGGGAAGGLEQPGLALGPPSRVQARVP
jgi:hypothetical protein